MDSLNSGRGNTVNTAVVLKEELWVAPTHRERRVGWVWLWWESLPLICSVSRRLGGFPCGGGSKTHGMLSPTYLYPRVSPTSSSFRWDPGSLPPTPGSNDSGGSTQSHLPHCSALICHFISLAFGVFVAWGWRQDTSHALWTLPLPQDGGKREWFYPFLSSAGRRLNIP